MRAERSPSASASHQLTLAPDAPQFAMEAISEISGPIDVLPVGTDPVKCLPLGTDPVES